MYEQKTSKLCRLNLTFHFVKVPTVEYILGICVDVFIAAKMVVDLLWPLHEVFNGTPKVFLSIVC